jgi:hypothetical protein
MTEMSVGWTAGLDRAARLKWITGEAVVGYGIQGARLTATVAGRTVIGRDAELSARTIVHLDRSAGLDTGG